MPSTTTETTARPATRHRPAVRHRVRLLTGVTAAAAVLALAACSSGGSSDAAAGSGNQTAAAQQGSGGSGNGSSSGERQNPGVSGEVAAVNGDTAQVQSSDSQTAVTWTSKTTVTQEVSGKLSDVTVGSCVLVTSSSDGSSGSSGSTDDSTPVAAATITVTAAKDGECTSTRGAGGFSGFGGRSNGSGESGQGEMPQGMPTGGTGEGPQGQRGEMPQGMPTGGSGSGSRGGFGGFGGFVSGKVTKVSGSTLTVDAVSFTMPTGGSTASGTQTPSTTTTARSVTVSGDTKYTVTKTAKTSAIKVGLCMTAVGQADSSGTVAATTVSLSTKSGDSCSTGFGGFGGFGRGQGGSQGGSGAQDGTGSDA